MSANQFIKDELALSPTDWKSLYIPYLPKDLMLDGIEINSEETIRDFFENKMHFGTVSRVDFVKKPSAADPAAQAVFVHFSSWTVVGGSEFRRYLEQESECKLNCYYNQYGQHFFVSSRLPSMKRFITVKINRTPIKEVAEVPKNMHQIVNNYGLMETLIEEQKKQIEELQSELAEAKKQIEGFQQAMSSSV